MKFIRHFSLFAFCAMVCVRIAPAQFGSGGSTGADGPYSPTTSGDFDPAALKICANNVCNFTTINIPSGVTIKLRASKLNNQAITWLAQGNVTISGTLDLSGATPTSMNTNQPAQAAAARVLPEPGPGGYTGGLGSLNGVAPQPGAGPGGGPAGTLNGRGNACFGGSASFIIPGSTNYYINTAPTYGSYLAVPLYGGSGGGGGWDDSGGTLIGGVGGAGGGALRIASNTQITVNGTINANGGDAGGVTGSNAGCMGGAGSGGTIHLVAPTISGSGVLTAASGAYPNYASVIYNGLIRFSTGTNGFTGSTSGLAPVVTALYLPPPNSTLPLPSLSITSINGQPVPPGAQGSYLNPDVTITANTAVNVNLAAANIPLGTIPTLRITAETGTDTVISCSGLSGASPAASTSTCAATFPYAISIAGVRATW